MIRGNARINNKNELNGIEYVYTGKKNAKHNKK